MAESLKRLFVTLDEHRATTLEHVSSALINIRTLNRFASPDSYAIAALRAPTAVVPTHKEIIIATVTEDKRCFNSIGTGILRSGIFLLRGGRWSIAAGNGVGMFARGNMQRAVEPHQLNAIPERTPHEPRAVVLVDDEVGVDGIPVVTPFTGADERTFVFPSHTIGKGGTAHQTDGRCVFPESGARISHPPTAVPTDNIGCPDMDGEAGYGISCPSRYAVKSGVARHRPRTPVGRDHLPDAVTGGKEIIPAVFKGHYGVVNHRRIGDKRVEDTMTAAVRLRQGNGCSSKKQHEKKRSFHWSIIVR